MALLKALAWKGSVFCHLRKAAAIGFRLKARCRFIVHNTVVYFFCLDVDAHVSWSRSRHSVRVSAGMVLILIWPREEFSKAAFMAVLLSGNSRIATTSYSPRQ